MTGVRIVLRPVGDEILIAIFMYRDAGVVVEGVDDLRLTARRIRREVGRLERFVVEVGEGPLFLDLVPVERVGRVAREGERAVDDVPAVIGGNDDDRTRAAAHRLLRRILEFLHVVGRVGRNGIAEVAVEPCRIGVVGEGELVHHGQFPYQRGIHVI